MQKFNLLFLRNNWLFFINNIIKTDLKQFKECKDREIHRECLYWFTQHLSYIQSSKTTENSLCNQSQITNYTTITRWLWIPQSPLTLFATPHTSIQNPTNFIGFHTPRMFILIPSRTHNTSWKHQYKNTIIKKEGNRKHLGKSQDQRS